MNDKKMNDKKLRIYTDGGCSNNGGFNKDKPTIGKFGYLVVDDKDEILHESFVKSPLTTPTNNQMEIQAIIFALNRLQVMEIEVGFDHCEIFTDSQYCLLGFSNYDKWLKKKKGFPNKEYWELAMHLYNKMKDKITFTWIKGHQDANNFNDYVDKKLKEL